MSETSPLQVEMDAPAKLNLGLEVVGRRGDGFHEIATIFVAIDLVDHLRLSASAELKLTCDVPCLAGPDNMALRALQALREETGCRHGACIKLRKHIPAAAGLGGASSDAAATLVAARELWRLPTSDASLHRIAADLGSDVPFFLRGGCAVGRGRGELLTALPVPDGLWFVIVAPEIAIPNKTTTLYARLKAEDFSDGERVSAQARGLAAGLPLDPILLGNAFSRPLYELAPHLAKLTGIMTEAGAANVSVSGAGPAHYAPFTDGAHAERVATRLREELGARARVILAQPAAERPAPSRPL